LGEIMSRDLIDYFQEVGFGLHPNGKVALPDWVQRIKIDVGLSYTAVNSIEWIREDKNLLVIGFEPLPESVKRLRQWLSQQNDSVLLEKQLVILPVALGREVGSAKLTITAADSAASSLLTPKRMVQKGSLDVQVFTLAGLLRLLPLEVIERVDYLKLDCQGMDLQILKGGGGELSKIALITAEAENDQYVNSSNSLKEMINFMNSHGFIQVNPRSEIRRLVGALLSKFSFIRARQIRLPVRQSNVIASDALSVSVEDPTFVNRAYIKQVISGQITATQRD
jgi:FkbM family methyltransferase